MGADAESQPYEFRFRLDEHSKGPGDRRALVAFVREQLKRLIDTADPAKLAQAMQALKKK